MRWLGGFVTNSREGFCPIPQGARLLSGTPCPIWTTGSWHHGEITTARYGGREAWLVGAHQVTATMLTAWLAKGGTPPAWPGTSTLIVREATGVQVFADPVQAAPVYYTGVAEGTAWGSSSRALAALTGQRIDLAWMGGAVSHPALFDPGERSAFADVATVLPGHRLTLEQGRTPSSRAWWRPPLRMPAHEAAQTFRSALEGGVATRLAGGAHLSSDLSGGLDSTTLCLLALTRAPAGSRVTGLTVRPAAVDRGGDLDYARAVLRQYDLDHVELRLSEECDPYAALDEVGPSDEPAPTTLTHARHLAAYRRLAALGSRRHMTGDGGDALLIQPPAYLHELRREHRYARFVRDVHGWAKLQKTSTWAHLRALMPHSRTGDLPPVTWSTEHARQLGADTSVSPVDVTTDEAVLAELRTIGRSAQADTQLAHAAGLDLHAPFLDRVVVESALAFDVADRGSPWRYKPQITTAFADLLPVAVRTRTDKGDTDVDHYRGLRAHLASVESLADGWLAGHRLIDPSRLRTQLQHAATGLPTHFGQLEPTLTTEIWTRVVTAAQPVRWTCMPVDEEPVG